MTVVHQIIPAVSSGSGVRVTAESIMGALGRLTRRRADRLRLARMSPERLADIGMERVGAVNEIDPQLEVRLMSMR